MTDETPPTKVYFSQPRDESLEAFKAWIKELTARITGNKEDDGSITDTEWERLHKEFWEKKKDK